MIHPRHPSTEESCYMTTHGYIYMYTSLSLLLGWNTQKPFYFPNAVTKPMTENLYFASLFRSYYKCPQHFSIVVLFCSLLRKGSFKVQYLPNCLISRHNKNYGPGDLSTNWQADHQLAKTKKDSAIIFSAWFFYHFIPRISFFLAWSPKIPTYHLGRQEILTITTD